MLAVVPVLARLVASGEVRRVPARNSARGHHFLSGDWFEEGNQLKAQYWVAVGELIDLASYQSGLTTKAPNHRQRNDARKAGW